MRSLGLGSVGVDDYRHHNPVRTTHPPRSDGGICFQRAGLKDSHIHRHAAWTLVINYQSIGAPRRRIRVWRSAGWESDRPSTAANAHPLVMTRQSRRAPRVFSWPGQSIFFPGGHTSAIHRTTNATLPTQVASATKVWHNRGAFHHPQRQTVLAARHNVSFRIPEGRLVRPPLVAYATDLQSL